MDEKNWVGEAESAALKTHPIDCEKRKVFVSAYLIACRKQEEDNKLKDKVIKAQAKLRGEMEKKSREEYGNREKGAAENYEEGFMDAVDLFFGQPQTQLTPERHDDGEVIL